MLWKHVNWPVTALYTLACELRFYARSWLCYRVFQMQLSGWISDYWTCRKNQWALRPVCIKQDGSFSCILQRSTVLRSLWIVVKWYLLLSVVTRAQKGGTRRRKAMSLLALASRTGKLQYGNTTYSLQQHSSTLSPLVSQNLKGLSFLLRPRHR